MEESSVIRVLDERAKYGKSAKTGKDWSMSRVELQNGESVFIFNPIDIGDQVEAVQDGEYKNWRKKRADPKHDEIMKALREIYKLLTDGSPKQEAKPAPTVDKVQPVVDGEAVSLDDIPF